jgi:predicted aspartyl protease
MIRGTVSDAGVPIIIPSIAGQEWTATIDTGFNGYLELPELLRNALNPQYIGRVTSILAGGQIIEEALYQVNFLFHGRVIPAEATFVADNEILIGTHLLREYRLQIDFVRRTVVLERVHIR